MGHETTRKWKSDVEIMEAYAPMQIISSRIRCLQWISSKWIRHSTINTYHHADMGPTPLTLSKAKAARSAKNHFRQLPPRRIWIKYPVYSYLVLSTIPNVAVKSHFSSVRNLSTNRKLNFLLSINALEGTRETDSVDVWRWIADSQWWCKGR